MAMVDDVLAKFIERIDVMHALLASDLQKSSEISHKPRK